MDFSKLDPFTGESREQLLASRVVGFDFNSVLCTPPVTFNNIPGGRRLVHWRLNVVLRSVYWSTVLYSVQFDIVKCHPDVTGWYRIGQVV